MEKTKTKKSFVFILTLIFVVIVGALSGVRIWSHYNEENVAGSFKRAPIPIKAVRVRKGPIQEWVFGQGTARAVRREFLTFEKSGKVTFLKKVDGRELRAGDFVRGPQGGERHGELLASLDVRLDTEDINVARAAVAEARERERAARANLDRAESNRKLADKDLDRVRKLFDRGVVAETQLDMAKANAENAAAEVKSAESELAAARSGVKAAEARLNQTVVVKEKTAIFAPFDGMVTYLNISEGDFYAPGIVDTSSEQSLLSSIPMVIIDASRFEITLDVPVFDGARVRSGQPAFVLLGPELNPESHRAGETSTEEAILRRSVKGEVFSVNPAVNPGGRSVQVKVRTTSGADQLRDGMFVTCWIVAEEKSDALIVPMNVFVFRDNVPNVFVVDESTHTVEQRKVTIGLGGISTGEITSNVQDRDLLVTEGRHRLTPGAPVEVISIQEEGVSQ